MVYFYSPLAVSWAQGTLQADGTEFDSSYKRGQPISFKLVRMGPCDCIWHSVSFLQMERHARGKQELKPVL